MIVWRIRGKIIETVLFCDMMCTTIVDTRMSIAVLIGGEVG